MKIALCLTVITCLFLANIAKANLQKTNNDRSNDNWNDFMNEESTSRQTLSFSDKFELNMMHAQMSKSAQDIVPDYQDYTDIDDQPTQCVKVMQNLTNNFIENGDMVLRIFRNSGKDYNDFGRFSDCTEIHHFNYFMAAVLKKFPIPMSMGVCVPAVCTLDDLNDFKPYMVKILNGAIFNIFKDVKGFNADTTVTEDDLVFVDSQKENDRVKQFDGGALLTCMILTCFTLGVTTSTFIMWYQKKEQKRIQQSKLKKMYEQRRSRSMSTSTSPDSQVIDSEQFESKGETKKKGIQSSHQSIVQVKPPRLPCMERFMACFSAIDNIKVFGRRRSKIGDEELECLNCVRVFACIMIILGNTYFYSLRGPLQNLEIIEQLMHNGFFSIVLSADLFVDLFFWLSAFLGSYQMLTRMHFNDDELGSKWRIYLKRWFRIFPLYFFTLLFFWRFIVLFGGDGPMFFQYDNMNNCDSYWIWHLLFLNNIIPWKVPDMCMNWTWYLADDMQFFLMLPFLVTSYYHNKRLFWYIIGGIFGLSFMMQMIVIFKNDLSASYFSYKDEYWTVYYEKPYNRVPAFLIGVIYGCAYFSFKHQSGQSGSDDLIASNNSDNVSDDGNMDSAVSDFQKVPFQRMFRYQKKSANVTLISMAVSIVVIFILVAILKAINNKPNDVALFWNMLYLIFQRPLFVLACSVFIMPMILQNRQIAPLTKFCSNGFWVPLARLSYGAYLSHSIFMIFGQYNAERGTWASEFDLFLFFLAYLTFAFLFSFIVGLIIDIPCQQLYLEFLSKKNEVNLSQAFYSDQATGEESLLVNHGRNYSGDFYPNQDNGRGYSKHQSNVQRMLRGEDINDFRQTEDDQDEFDDQIAEDLDNDDEEEFDFRNKFKKSGDSNDNVSAANRRRDHGGIKAQVVSASQPELPPDSKGFLHEYDNDGTTTNMVINESLQDETEEDDVDNLEEDSD